MTVYEPYFWGEHWWAKFPGGGMVQISRDEAECRAWCDRANAKHELDRRKNAALDRAIALDVPVADVWRAIDEDTLLQYEEQKSCGRCQVAKPVGEFGGSATEADGFARNCKACDRVRLAEALARRREAESADVPVIVEGGGR